MATTNPTTELDRDYSSPGATTTPWSEGIALLERAELYFISTVRPDGRPHVTPVIGIWLDDALHFCTGANEQKARNLAKNPHCILLTGSNTLNDGFDIVLEGDAAPVRDEPTLRRLAARYEEKYGPTWHFDVRDGEFHGDFGNVAQVFAVAPKKVYGYSNVAPSSATRWRF